MADSRIEKFASILVDYSTAVKPGDRVAIYATTLAEPLVQAIFNRVLQRGGYPHVLFELQGEREAMYALGNDDQLDYISPFLKMAFEEFDVLIKIRSDVNTRAHTNVPPERIGHYSRMLGQLIAAQMRRGADGSLRWMSTLYPSVAFAMEAEMGVAEYEDFFYRSVHADAGTPDPVAYWQDVQKSQQVLLERIQGSDKIELHGPNVDLSLSVRGRTFINACGAVNMPDGEIFTGPVEDSANGWVRYTYPALYQGRVVDGIELVFEQGKVVKASARQNQDLLLQMIDTDPGARYLGEFAIGLNYEINRFTRSILLDEKIGGSFHMALGAGYPDTGSVNKSLIHWDMICDMRQDSEIRADGEVFYRNGQFV
ncbi:MAG: aminopeptidase [Chloroflexi bacterium]|nr:aminopeptidase [Chloroflexota bacterium]